jgi:hypothetical protein
MAVKAGSQAASSSRSCTTMAAEMTLVRRQEGVKSNACLKLTSRTDPAPFAEILFL